MFNTIYSLKEVSAYQKMIRLLMYSGQKNKAVNVFLDTVFKILEKTRRDKHIQSFEKQKIVNIFSIFDNAIKNVSPFLEVRKVRVSGKTRQIPSMIQKSRQQTLAIRWLIDAAKNRKKKNLSLSDCLATELIDAANKRGGARQKRNELHKIAHSNRTFLRYRWW